MPPKSALGAALKGKCPRCRKGNMFKAGVLEVHKLNQTHEKCSHCGLLYEMEPGFWFGAMYVSYAFSVGILLANVFVLYNLFDDPETWVYITSVLVSSLLLYPFNFRYSRIIFLYVFGGVKFDGDKY